MRKHVKLGVNELRKATWYNISFEIPVLSEIHDADLASS